MKTKRILIYFSLIFLISFLLVNLFPIDNFRFLKINSNTPITILNPIIGSYNTPTSNGYEIEISGNIAYITDGNGGLRCVNVSDPTNPIEIGSYNESNQDNIRYIEIAGDIAYLTNLTHLITLNISDPTNPYRIGIINPSGNNLRDMELAGNILYLNNYLSVFNSYSISNPANPTFLNSAPNLGLASDISGDLAVVLYTQHIYLVNISNPSSMDNISNIYFSATCNYGAVKIHGNVAFIGTNNILHPQLLVIDISNPLNPIVLYNDSSSQIFDIEISGDLAYVACDFNGLKCYNIQDPSNPIEIGSLGFATVGSVRDVEIEGDILYSVSTTGFKCIKIGDIIDPIQESYYDGAGVSSRSIAVDSNVAYIGTLANTLITVNISDPAATPMLPLMNSLSTSSQVIDVKTAGNVAYLALVSNGLYTVNISDPLNLNYLGNYSLTGATYAVALDGDEAYVGNSVGGLYAFSILDPANPTYLNNNNLGGVTINDIAISGNIAYLATESQGLIIVNITDPSNLSELTRLNTGISIAKQVSIAGNVAYIANSSGLVSVDITDPSNPSILGFLNTNGTAIGVSISGDLACVAVGNLGMWCINISDPTNPTLVQYINTNYAYEIVIEGDFAFIADSIYEINSIRIRQAGTYDFDNDTLTYIKEVWEHNTDPSVDNSPWSSHPSDDNTPINSVYNITWYLFDIVGSGYYRVISNGSFSTNWATWTNNTQINISIDTTTVGSFSYTIEYNNSLGLNGTPDTVIINIYDNVPPWESNNPSDAQYEYKATPSDIIWTLQDNLGYGNYRVLRNKTTVLQDWTPWSSNGTVVTQTPNTDLTIGVYNYSIEFTDNSGNTAHDEVFITIVDTTNPWIISTPTNGSVAYGSISSFSFQPRDNYLGGHFRIISNQTGASVGWTNWANFTIILINVNTSQLVSWSYKIEYNDSLGNWGTSVEIIRTVYDSVNPWDNDPSDISIGLNTIGNITWRLYDNVVPNGEGVYNVTSNSSVNVPWTPWAQGGSIVIIVDTTTIGNWSYIIHYNDSVGNSNTDEVIITVYDNVNPWGTTPPNANIPWNGVVNVTFNLYDNVGGGQYRITSNSTYSKGWTSWTNNTQILETIGNLAPGTWSFTIEYTDSYGNSGTPITFIIAVGPIPTTGGIPGFELLYIVIALVSLIYICIEKKSDLKN
ncbi:MAG: hypothetical protein ACTSPY_10575 [Candidatus Helarchaeota archaeon]